MITYILFLIFIISDFLHLTARINFLALARFDFVLSLLLMSMVFFSGQYRNIFKNPTKPTKILIALLGYVILTLPMVKWPGSVLRFGLYNYFKVVLFYFFVVATASSPRRLWGIVWVFVGCQIVRILEPIYLHITDGYWGDIAYADAGRISLDRLAGGPYDIVNSNQFAWVIVTTFSFVFYLMLLGRFRILKLITLLFVPIAVYGLVLTASRSGMVSMIVLILMFIYLSRNKVRNFILFGIISVFAAIVIFQCLPDDLQQRYLSLVDSDAVGRDTVVGRFDGLKESLGVFDVYAITGHGLGTNHEMNWNILRSKTITHNLYLEVFQELGFIGLCIFIYFVYSLWIGIGKALDISKLSQQTPDLRLLLYAIKAWIGMHLVYSISCFGLSSWEWYLLGGFSVVACELAERQTLASANGNFALQHRTMR